MADSLWENNFRDFLLSHCGRDLIEKCFDRNVENESSSSNFRSIFSIFFNGLTIADSCSAMLIYLKTNPAKTIERCHRILTEVGRKLLEEKNVKEANSMVRH